MFECGDCGKGFPSGWRARENHCNATGHNPPEFECDTCDLWFDDNYDKSEHMKNWGHQNDNLNYYECDICIELFTNRQDRTDHEVDHHHWCRDCQRQFINRNNIKQHLNSRTHRGQKIVCPFCKNSFTTATGMTHHVENGACSAIPNWGREKTYRFIRSRDPTGVISKKLIGWTGDSGGYEAGQRSWNGSAYECYFCHREFRTLYSLNQHLNSPAHQQALYHCPNRRCGQDFKTLGGVINHLESESCGAMRFETVQRKIGDIVSGNRLISF
ncbi:hypothetical protein QBC38DRAFT_372664 [Podospora fimiseda]|uniref:C2H2-type domain-containing protein n=1 Tax=Podospora fimiseda TaxID=252190 RepID=A0AAN7GP57_9PEZI|nr:hypothetical protein QBC38DRAFT_372664 [Podospora fimiseda]